MKKFLLGILLILSACVGSVALYSRHGHHGGGGGGSSFAGGLAGGMVGGVVAGAMTKDSGPSRGEIEAKRAQDQTQQLAREQEMQRYSMLQQQMSTQGASTTTIVLIIALVILFIAILAMGMMMFRMKK
jgi:hypothetical protein